MSDSRAQSDDNDQQTTEQRDVSVHHDEEPPEFEYDVGQCLKLKHVDDTDYYIVVKSRVWNYDADLETEIVKMNAYRQYLIGNLSSLGGDERLITHGTLMEEYEPVEREVAKERVFGSD